MIIYKILGIMFGVFIIGLIIREVRKRYFGDKILREFKREGERLRSRGRKLAYYMRRKRLGYKVPENLEKIAGEAYDEYIEFLRRQQEYEERGC